MCGIVGYVGPKPVRAHPVEGLRRLEYRGYDSAGVALSCTTARLDVRRARASWPTSSGAGRRPARGRLGIGHTRWATHGRPTEENAHPHRDCTGRIVVVHNGIIENYLALKARARRPRATSSSPRPTPRSSRTWSSARCEDDGLESAVRRALRQLRGLYAHRADLGRRPGHDRRGAQRPAGRRRPRRRRVLRRLRHPGDPVATRATSSSSTTARWRC